MATIRTIRVRHGDGFVTINASDFDPRIHEEFKPEGERPKDKIVERPVHGKPNGRDTQPQA